MGQKKGQTTPQRKLSVPTQPLGVAAAARLLNMSQGLWAAEGRGLGGHGTVSPTGNLGDFG